MAPNKLRSWGPQPQPSRVKSSLTGHTSHVFSTPHNRPSKHSWECVSSCLPLALAEGGPHLGEGGAFGGPWRRGEGGETPTKTIVFLALLVLAPWSIYMYGLSC